MVAFKAGDTVKVYVKIKEGNKEFCRLLKMVAYCEMYGYDDDYMFM